MKGHPEAVLPANVLCSGYGTCVSYITRHCTRLLIQPAYLLRKSPGRLGTARSPKKPLPIASNFLKKLKCQEHKGLISLRWHAQFSHLYMHVGKIEIKIFFRKIVNNPDNPLFNLLPPPRDAAIIGRLQSVHLLPIPGTRTSNYRSFIHYALPAKVKRIISLSNK